jgi:uncharacterized membrane protein YeaQ/YmgE (transglycosylase-associated protein family)
MSILAWIVLGIVSGFIASSLVSGSGRGVIVDMILGVVGAFVGGATFNFFGHVGITGFNLWSMLVAVIGAVLVLVIYRLLTRNDSPRAND